MLAVAGIFDLVVLGVVLLVAPVTHALCIGHEHAAIARHAVNEPALLFTRSLCFFFFFLLLKALHALSPASIRGSSAAHSRHIFRWRFCTRNTRPSQCHWFSCLFLRRVFVISFLLSLFLICVYVLRGCARACSRLSSLSHVYIRVYMSRRKSFSVCLLFFSLPLPTFVWSFSDLLFLSFSNTNTRNYDFSLIFLFFYYESRFKKIQNMNNKCPLRYGIKDRDVVSRLFARTDSYRSLVSPPKFDHCFATRHSRRSDADWIGRYVLRSCIARTSLS